MKYVEWTVEYEVYNTKNVEWSVVNGTRKIENRNKWSIEYEE